MGLSITGGRGFNSAARQWQFSPTFQGRDLLGINLPCPNQPMTLETIKGPYAFINQAGTRFRMVNLVTRPTDSAKDDNNPVPTPDYFYDIIFDIGTNGPTDPAWTHWLRPQIDAVQALGANCVRMIWDAGARVGDASHNGPPTWRGSLTQVQLANVIDLVCTYLASKGMYFYPAALEANTTDVLPSASILSYIAEFVAKISTYSNVIGCDVMQEFERSTYAVAGNNLSTIVSTAKAARGTYKIPITCSIAAIGANVATHVITWITYTPLAKAAGVDYIDLHFYAYSGGLIFDLVSPNIDRYAIITGESGVGFNGGYFDFTLDPAQEAVHPFASQMRTRHYQDTISSIARRHDIQLQGSWGAVKEWTVAGQDNQDWGLYDITQNGSFAFTSPRSELTGPLSLMTKNTEAYNVSHTLDLTGPDTTYAAYANTTSYMLGWAHIDYSNTFTRSAHRVKRPNGLLGTGLVNFWVRPSQDQSVQVDFNAAQSISFGGEIDWSVSLRHQASNPLALQVARYYVATITSKPLTGSDGLLTIYRAIDGVFTLVASGTPVTPLNLTHSYRLQFQATGSNPTTLTATLTDITSNTSYTSVIGSDGATALQSAGLPGIPTQIGDVYYTNVQYVSTANSGPSLAAPTVVSNVTSTIGLSWPSASGGITPYIYVPQYSTADANGFPTSTEWISLPLQTASTVTVPNLTPGSPYIFRVNVIDSTARAPNLFTSPWTNATAGSGVGILPPLLPILGVG